MKLAIAALFAGIAAAAPTAQAGEPTVETVTISDFGFASALGYPQISFFISSQRVDRVHCGASHYEVDGVYKCDDSSYTFRILEEQGLRLRLAHVLNGPSMAGDFVIRANGPLSTVLSQVGTSTADLDKQTTA